ncbi:MSHA biogenesis protein MshL [Gammaproteobacteria bacterium]
MILRSYFLTILTWALTACTTFDVRRDDLTEQIDRELSQATKIDDSLQAHVENTLLPPLAIPLAVNGTDEPEQRFTLTVNNAPAREVFIGLAVGTPYSILLHPEVTGSVSLSLKNVTLFEALDTLRDVYGYDYRLEGKRVMVLPLTLQTRIFRVNYLIGKREGSSELRVISGSVSNRESSNTAQSNSFSAPNTTSGNNSNALPQENSHITTESKMDFWTDLSQAITSLIGHESGRNVVINPQAGIVAVRAMPAELRDVADFLRTMKLSVERQVILEAKIINVTLNDSYQAGINWSAMANSGHQSLVFGKSSENFNANATGTTLDTKYSTLDNTALTVGGGLFGISFVHKNFKALLEFLQTQGQIQVLSSPRIATLNNQKAVLKVGTDEFFVTGVSSSYSLAAANGTTSQTTPNVTLQPFFSGITLDVTPRIDEENYVILHIHPSVSEVSQSSQRIDLGNNGVLNLPLAKSNVSETDSIIRTRNGQIVAIGGLMTQSMNNDRAQLPGIGDLPVVGELFRNTNQSLVKKELVILLKTTVVQDDDAWIQSIRDYKN